MLVERLKNIKTMTSKSFDIVFEWLIEILKPRSKQLYRVMVEELEEKGLKPGFSPDNVRDLLVEYVERKGYYGIIYVNGNPLPVVSAAQRIYSYLKNGQEVVIGFSKYKGPYPPVHEEIKAKTLDELFRRLKK